MNAFHWLVLSSLCLLAGILMPFTMAAESNDTISTQPGYSDATTYYVMEPFDRIDSGWFHTSDITLSLETKEQKFGNSALRIDWNKTNIDQEFGWILQDTKPHNVFGAKFISLWYKVLQSQGLETLQVSLLDDSVCVKKNGYQSELCALEENLLVYDVPVHSLGMATKNDPGSWEQMLIPIEMLDPSIDLKRLRGWKIRLSTSSSDNNLHTVLMVDHLSFVGGGDLFGAAFLVGTAMDFSERLPDDYFENDGIPNSLWQHTYYESDISSNETTAYLSSDGFLDVNYTIEQAEAWGGYVGFGFIAPGNAHYDLSDATDLSIQYSIPKAASIPGHAIFRLILEEVSDCPQDCYITNLLHERYYSFHPILDEQAKDEQLVIPLLGSRGPTTPFWLTGWAGILGNEVFDRDMLKGFYLELVLDSQLGVGGLVDGRVQFSGLKAVKGQGGSSDSNNNSQCHVIDGVQFSRGSPTMQRYEFLGNICCQLCSDDPDCLYGLAWGRDCYLAHELDPGYVSIIPRQTNVSDAIQILGEGDPRSFWIDDPIRRGEFCTLCDCYPEIAIIDCAGKELKILPQTFNPDIGFKPRILDLRGNDRLAIIGTGLLLDSFAESLEEILLPRTMKHIGYDLFSTFPLLATVKFETDSDGQVSTPNNIIQGPDDFFSDVCCNRATHIDLASPREGLEFCELIDHSPGIDSLYEDFKFYGYDNLLLVSISPSSKFMSEAAESAEKCAEYCTISEGCRYFQYDARLPNAEHVCTLFKDVSQPAVLKCCEADDYADLNQTLPGWVVGTPPRTRHEMNGASVSFSSESLVAKESNKFSTQYNVALGATPLRGAVWIEPKIATPGFEVEIKPKRVVLYDGDTSATINISVKNVNNVDRSTLVIANIVESCDVAYKQSSGRLVYVEVIQDDSRLSTGIIVAIFLVLILLGSLLFWYLNKRILTKTDSMWKVKREELSFDDPPSVLGRGTFGLVLLAEYRGTKVAVKRAVPPLNNQSTHFSMMKDIGSEEEASEHDGEVKVLESLGRQSSLSHFGGSSRLSKNSWSRLKEDFVAEMRILSKLRHPCITTVMGGVLSRDIEPALVMEYMEHRSLYELLHNETFVFDGELTINMLRDISQGLRFLHASNPQVIHGDLKGANILVDRKFRAKVADFGLSQKHRLGATGTPYWMAPELLRKEASNSSASDIYSFGIILYEVYSRKDPYKGEDQQEVLRQIIDKDICKRPPIPEGCPAEVQSLMESCLFDDESKRPNAEEIDNRLRRAWTKQLAPADPRKGKRMSLFDIFPAHVAKALEEGRDVEPEHREEVTIFFSDIVGFTTLSSTISPHKVANMLDRLYHKFDALSQQHDLYKVETIGDAYLAVTNLVKDQPHDHAKRIADFSIDAVKAANQTMVDEDDASKGFVNIRVGFHSGPIVADVVGNRNRKYTLFGDTINTSSRMESTSKTNRIQCSEASASLLRKQAPDIPLVSRGFRPIKGKGVMLTFWVNEYSKDGSKTVDDVIQKARRHTAPDDFAMLRFAGQAQKELEEEHAAQPAKYRNIEKGMRKQSTSGRRRSSFFLPSSRKSKTSNRRVSFHTGLSDPQDDSKAIVTANSKNATQEIEV